MIGFLERAAAARPGAIAVVTPEGSITYGALLARAHRIAAGLAERGISRFAVLETDAATVLALLGGAAYAGAEICLYQPDTDAAEFLDHAPVLGHTHVVARRSDLGPVIAPLELESDAPLPDRSPTQPLLIRTTGTTGRPKAARHDWRILGRTVESATPRPDRRWLLAYGPQQMAGIQILMHVMASQGTLVAPFPRQPKDGLQAILEHGVTAVSATPTYWRFLLTQARSAGIELPPLAQITLGGEAIPPDLLTELTERFPDARISQVYASTELGSVASTTDGRHGFSAGKLFAPQNPDGTLRVIDGQLWARADAGMLGYVGDDEAPEEHEGWRATGDLVEVVGDRIEFRGRTSEVINVGGVKVAPLPIENRIAALDGVDAVRVFGRANRLTGAIVAADIVAHPESDQDAIRAGVRTATEDLPAAWRPRSITFVEALETLGDKTIRRMES